MSVPPWSNSCEMMLIFMLITNSILSTSKTWWQTFLPCCTQCTASVMKISFVDIHPKNQRCISSLIEAQYIVINFDHNYNVTPTFAYIEREVHTQEGQGPHLQFWKTLFKFAFCSFSGFLFRTNITSTSTCHVVSLDSIFHRFHQHWQGGCSEPWH